MVPLLNTQNVGIARNLNNAFRACTGDLLVGCGGDDLYLPSKLESQVRWFERHPSATLCAHDVEYFDAVTEESRGFQSQFGSPKGHQGPSELLRRGNVFHAISVMYRRSALPPWGADERIPVSNDHKLWIDILMNGKEYGYIPEVLAKYRVGNRVNVTVRESDRIWREGFQILGLVESEHPELTLDCQVGRARLFKLAALASIKTEPKAARTDLFRALIHNAAAPSLYFWMALSLVPQPFRNHLLALARRRPTREG